jgi:RecB family exonuclease
VITPRRTRLVRVPDLQTFRRLTVRLALAGGSHAAARLVVVPNRSAARQLRRIQPDASWPDLVTRDQFYDRLQSRLDPSPARLTPYAREAAMHAASHAAAASGTEPPFALRPALVAEMLRFYDQLRRQRQSVDRFEELIVDSLSGNPDDRGAERMLRQTQFLAAAFRAYQERVDAAGALDEHGLRERLVATASPDPIRDVVVTVADWIADPDGLFVADFDLLTRLPGLETIDIVATTGTLASGFHQRVHDWLPGLSETDAEALGVGGPWEAPVWSVPGIEEPSLAFVRRDREEELVAVARRVASDPAPAAVVFRRPLPYLYLARKVFADAGVAYQAHDALPLASEPFIAAVDLVAEFVLSSFARPAAVALLRSPHFEWSRPGREVTRDAIAALDRVLSDSRYLGELDRLRRIPVDTAGESAERQRLLEAAQPAYDAALEAAVELAPLLDAAPLSVQLGRFSRFVDAHVEAVDERQARARATLAGVLQALGAAYAEHVDPEATVDAVVAELHRWIEEETFVPGGGEAGLQLVDAQAARYAQVADLFVVGLIQGEWPERQRRNIFYPPGPLAALGWPSEADRRRAELAAFVDLLRSPTRGLELSTFTLDDEALVEPSALVEEAPGAGLAVEVRPILTEARLFEEERLSIAPPVLDGLDEPSLSWAEMRLGRTAPADRRYHGEAGDQEPRPVSVSALETYLQCPFKYYARHVLRLEEEPDDEEVMDPRRQGELVHAVFEDFFREWDGAGRGAITPDTLDEAHALFTRIIEPHLARLPDTEAAIERTRLLGSSVAPGFADAVFRMEAERPVPVKERRLEFPLKGPFVFQGPSGQKTVEVRGVADRVDLLADGTFRLVDYKLSTAPATSQALQLPIYGLCAEQKLGGRWTLGEAAYVTFRGPRRVVPLFTARSDRDEVLAGAQARFLAAVDGIEGGHFPPTPTDVFLCSFCSYGAVCRKDYVGDVG